MMRPTSGNFNNNGGGQSNCNNANLWMMQLVSDGYTGIGFAPDTPEGTRGFAPAVSTDDRPSVMLTCTALILLMLLLFPFSCSFSFSPSPPSRRRPLCTRSSRCRRQHADDIRVLERWADVVARQQAAEPDLCGLRHCGSDRQPGEFE